MCGIAGEIQSGRLQEASPTSTVQSLVEELRARGPDSEGTLSGPGWCLGHTRLSIQDLTNRAHQPLRLPELGLSITYNGEIYNFRDLRRELTSHGYSFFSDSDTEVLLKGFHKWGKDLLPRLKGIFALAIYDENSQKVFVARDRLGVKPFYYSLQEGLFRFCSSLPPLLPYLKEGAKILPRALNYYLSFHSVVPAPWTLIKGIYKLPPGTWAEWSGASQLNPEPYWNLDFSEPLDHKSWSSEDWEKELEVSLQRAVKRRLMADVPVGLYLSGGLDSSLIAAFMAQESADPVRSYSIGFAGKGSEEGHEFRYSRMVAEKFKTEHQEFFVSTAEILENLPGCLQVQPEPMTSHDNIAFYLLSQKASESIKVVQSGQGADEVFAGYHWYPKLAQSPEDPVRAYAESFFDRDFLAYQGLVQKDFVEEDHALNFVTQHFGKGGASHAVDKALRLDTTVMLVEDPVKRLDTHTAAFGMEARVPFLDHEVVELAAKMPAELKLKNGGKGILKDIGYRHLPRELIDRPKGYFPVPELKYIDGPFLDLTREILLSKTAAERGIFQHEKIEKYLADPRGNITPLGGSKLWQIAALEWWLQIHKIEA